MIDQPSAKELDQLMQIFLLVVIQFLAGWLINHILGSDKKIGEYMREHGIKEE